MTLDVEQMPERVWLWVYPKEDGRGEWYTEDVGFDGDETVYVRADLFDAQAAEIAVLKAQVARYEAALRDCLSILDGLIEESGREIEWGEEDPFRMGEWFEEDDLARIKAARAALSAEGEE